MCSTCFLQRRDICTAVLVAVDVFSRFAILTPMYSVDSMEATELATLLIINGTGGVPKWILTDNGAEFKGEFAVMCEHYGVHLKRSAPEHSQSHGIVERLVATTELTLAHFIDEEMDGSLTMAPDAGGSAVRTQ